ncbi:MAG: primosomal protein N' [Candidatus Methylomirabilales bacterium]
MPCTEPYVDVVFPGFEAVLTYLVPPDWAGLAVPGVRVLAPLGRRTVTGYLVQSRPHPPVADLKALREILDPEPLLDSHLLRLTRWAADYYLAPWGEVIRTALPPGIDSFTRQIARLTAAGASMENAGALLRPGEADVLQALRQTGSLPVGRLLRRRPEARRLLQGLLRRGLVEMDAELQAPRVRPLAVPHCRLASGVTPETAPVPARAAKQRAILQALAQAPSGVPKAEAIAAGSAQALAVLVKKGLVELATVEVMRDPFATRDVQADQPLALTAEQADAVSQIAAALTEKRFFPALLHGVTGSGKTEVYLQAIQAALALGRQALVLVPEIALTPLTVQRFLARFGTRVAVLHSGLTGGERFDAWRRIRAGKADIVVGARSAVFAPLPRLGIVVVDEEHDPSYKQDETPRYHARDVAVMRAKLLEAPVILGSATPSLESYERAQAGRYRLLRLRRRIESRALPQVEIVDLRRIQGGERLLSPPLAAALADRLAKGEQSLLFLNRRGFSTLLLCQECGATAGCPHCSVSLTLHAGRGRLRCHTCDFERRPPERCPTCQGSRLRYLGFGTQQIEAAVQAQFPAARVARMDRDSVRSWREAERVLGALARGEVDVLVGTQMTGKGHDVPNLTLVGVVSADMALHLPDFRAGERAFALLTQVVGRAGRGERSGLALIQTFNPDHYILQAVRGQDYDTLWAAEAPLRREQRLPPFSRAVLAVLSSAGESAAERAARELAAQLQAAGIRAAELMGPAPAALYRVRSRYRWHVLVRGQDVRRLHARVREAAARFQATPAAAGVRLDLDVDPAELC